MIRSHLCGQLWCQDYHITFYLILNLAFIKQNKTNETKAINSDCLNHLNGTCQLTAFPNMAVLDLLTVYLQRNNGNLQIEPIV